MALKIKNLGSLQHDKDMDRLYALVAAMKKRMPAKDEGALNNSTYEQNCKDVQNHWQKVNQRNSGKRVDINLPAGEVGNAVGHDATDLAKEQAAFEGKPVGKDSFTQRNAIAARKNVVTVHKLESAEIVHKNVGDAQRAYQAIMDDLNA